MDVETVARRKLLDGVLIPRANGSNGLEQVEDFLATTLETSGAEVERRPFTATPFGLQLAWTTALLLMVGSVASTLCGWFPLAILLALATPALLLAEFELLRSPVSGLFKREEHNVLGRFGGRPGGPRLVLCAHFDTATHFGDHHTWGPLGWWWLGPAVALAVATAIAGLQRGSLPVSLSLPFSILALAPFAAMVWYQAAGPLLGTPSTGALDNGGSVIALLELAGRLGHRPTNSQTTVEILFTAAEEERAFGSRAYAATLDPEAAIAVVNLELIGADGPLGLVAVDGFALRRFSSPPWLVEMINDTAREALGSPLLSVRLPAGTLTDGRSFLARGIPAVTLTTESADGFPRQLHSSRDNRDRLSLESLDRCSKLLDALVDRLDTDRAF